MYYMENIFENITKLRMGTWRIWPKQKCLNSMTWNPFQQLERKRCYKQSLSSKCKISHDREPSVSQPFVNSFDKTEFRFFFRWTICWQTLSRYISGRFHKLNRFSPNENDLFMSVLPTERGRNTGILLRKNLTLNLDMDFSTRIH